MNLIPDIPSETPSYWCTWGIQSYSCPKPNKPTWQWPVSQMQEHLLFDQPGWFARYGSDARRDLYLLFDVGWDLPNDIDPDNERWRFGSLEVNTERFPSCVGTSAQKLTTLNQITKSAGWRGAALWVSPQAVGDGQKEFPLSGQAAINYWRERLRWSRDAGIEYWKVDVGFHANSAGYRRMLTELARKEYPELVIEHAPMAGPLNDIPVPWEQGTRSTGTGGFISQDGVYERALALMTFSDVFRTYDVTAHLSTATTLDRVARLLTHAVSHPGAKGLINCEDEPYLGAALGCAIGIMRHPSWQTYEGVNYDPGQYHQRIDEVTRAVRWQRIAPAFGVGDVSSVDDAECIDEWSFQPGETWAEWVHGKIIQQAAPARVARNLALPEVIVEGEPPYAVASRHPNGAVAVATLARTSIESEIHTPLADITLNVSEGVSLVGVFGHYRTLTFILPHGQWQVWGQDLKGEVAQELSQYLQQTADRLTIPGKLVDEIGLQSATPGDKSQPGLVLKFVKATT